MDRFKGLELGTRNEQVQGRPAFWGFIAMNGTELYGETTVPKLGKIEAPHGPGLGLDPNPAVRDKFRV